MLPGEADVRHGQKRRQRPGRNGCKAVDCASLRPWFDKIDFQHLNICDIPPNTRWTRGFCEHKPALVNILKVSLSIAASLVPNIVCWFHSEVPEVAVVIRKLPPERLDSNGPFHKGFPVLNYNLPGGPSIRADPNELTFHTHLFSSLNKSPGRLMSVSRYGH